MFAASKTNSASTGGYQISRSLRFNSADSAYLNRSLSTATNAAKFTMSLWVKRSTLSSYQDFLSQSGSAVIFFNNSDQLSVVNASGSAYTSAVFRDVSAWYHIVFVFDSTNATSGDRIIIYVNGVRQATSSYTAPSLNATGGLNTASAHYIGSYVASSEFLNGYMTELNFIDGQALTPSSFGETNAQTGVWQPKAYAGTYGTNGFYLNFSDNSNITAATLGKDSSGNGNNWTPNNFSVTTGSGNDSLVDTPTSYGIDAGVGGEVRGNYCTWNPNDVGLGGAGISDGGLYAGGSGYKNAYGTFPMSSGKWYCEFACTSQPGNIGVGISATTSNKSSDTAWNFSPTVFYGSTGQKFVNASATSYGATWTSGDVIGMAVDIDAGTVTFYKNGTSQGVISQTLSGQGSGQWVVSAASGQSGGGMGFYLNSGQRAFTYTAPSGYKALCTTNLPTPAIGATTATQAGKYFNPVLYTGNGAVNTVTGMGFQPDMLWNKDRTSTGNNVVNDAVRGINKVLITDLTLAEITGTTYLTSFDSDGFSMNTASPAFNYSGRSYVAWGWKANGSGSTNTAGSITSTVSANTTSGFSIATYTGTGVSATVGHGLGVAPSCVIVKARSQGTGYNWAVYHVSLGNTKFLNFNNTNAAGTSSAVWNNTTPTSTVFTLGNDGAVVGSGETFVAYCFAEVTGYSEMGSYTGNGSTDGPFVYCGFRPAYVLIKRSSGVDSWVIHDTARNTYNVTDARLLVDTTGAEVTTDNQIDVLSNGFKMRSTNSATNQSGETYIFVAFASAPFNYSLAR